MTVINGYCTVEDLRQRLSMKDSDDEQILENVIEAVSRQIETWCKRRFYTTSTDEPRYYTPDRTDLLCPGDLISITTLKTDENADRTYERTWATTDYDLLPYNATLDNLPYNQIEISPLGRYRFPIRAKSVEITGKFGFATTPDPVNEACLIQSERIFRRKDSPFGLAGTPEFGQLRLLARLDPDVEALLVGYRRLLVA